MAENDQTPKLVDLVRQQIFQWFGIKGLLVLALLAGGFIVWTQWHTVKTWPGISAVVGYLGRAALPQADPTRLSVAVADLEDDDPGHDHKDLIVRLLRDFEGIRVLDFDRTISVKGPVPDDAERRGHQTAQEYLKESSVSILIWGRVLRHGNQTRPDLYLTAVGGGVDSSRQYTLETNTEFGLPKVFWSDLSDVLRLVISSQDSQFRAKRGQYIADRLLPFIDRVRSLLNASVGRAGWDADALGATRVILADALQNLGKQSWQNEPLEEAITTYGEALKEMTRDRVPLEWAAIQNNLGIALSTMGEREGGTARLEMAVAAYRAALEERTRERMPLDWAAIQNNLGNVLRTLGERGGGTARLEEAIAAVRAALSEYTRERVPLRWAMTQDNLGNALSTLGERESGTAHLQEAVAAHRAALKERTRERVPLDWAMTQNNLVVSA